MNWFDEVYLHWVMNPESDVISVDIMLMGFYTLVSGLLVVRKKLTSRSLAITAALAVAVTALDIDPRPWVSAVVEGPSVFHNMTKIAWLLVLGWLFSVIVIGLCFRKRQRTVHRLAVGVSVFAITTLLYAYHLVFINGALAVNLAVEEQRVTDLVNASAETFEEGCQWKSVWCIQAGPNAPLDVTGVPEINKQIRDHVGFYRARGGLPRTYSFSRGLVVSNTPFALAIRETESETRMVLSREGPSIWMQSTAVMFSMFTTAAQVFWVGFAVVVITSHDLMIRNRRRRRPATSEGGGCAQAR